MARAFTATITGIRATKRKLSSVSDAVQIENARAMDIMVKRIEADAKRLVPRKTANLQRTITSEVEFSTRGGVIGLVGANTKYAKRLEDPKKGLRHRTRRGFIGKPTPYLIPALNKNFGPITRAIVGAVKRSFKLR